MHHWQKSYLDWTAFGRRIPLWGGGPPFNKSLRGSLGFVGWVGLQPPAYLCGLLLHNCNNRKMGPCANFSGIKEKYFDLSTFLYTHLVTRPVYTCLHSSSDSSTFVYICLWLIYIRLHSSSDSSVFLE